MKIEKFKKEPIVELNTSFVPSKNFYRTNDKDNWFEELKRYYLNTATLSSIVDFKHKTMIGEGLTADNDIDKLKLSNINFNIESEDKGPNINEILWNFFFDFSLYGVGALHIEYNAERTNILKINYIDPTKLRISYLNKYNYELKTFWFKTNWIDCENQSKYIFNKEVKEFQRFGIPGTETEQVLYFHDTPLSLGIYPIPWYRGAFKSVKTEMNIMDYYENLSSNGFMGNILLNFNDGDPGDEQKIETMQELQKFLGPNAQSLAMVQFNSNGQNAATIEKFNTEAEDTKFLNLIQEYKANIISKGACSPALVGLEIPGKLGDRNTIEEQYEKFLNTEIKTIREKFLKIWNKEINPLLLEPLSTDAYFENMTLFTTEKPTNNNEFVVKYKKEIDE